MKLAKSMSAVKVPATVQAILASRIDRLPAEEKELLQTLAVLGREFPLSLVQRVTRKPGTSWSAGSRGCRPESSSTSNRLHFLTCGRA
jgi:predicted ATPase